MGTPRWMKPGEIDRENFSKHCRALRVSETRQVTTILNMWATNPRVRRAVALAEAEDATARADREGEQATHAEKLAQDREKLEQLLRTPDEELDPTDPIWGLPGKRMLMAVRQARATGQPLDTTLATLDTLPDDDETLR